MDEYYRNTIKKDNFSNLKESAQLINIFLRNSKQICNLSALLQKDKYLEGLNSINEVYDSQVNLMEEITLYHKEYRSKNAANLEQLSQNHEGIKLLDFDQVFDTHNIIDKN